MSDSNVKVPKKAKSTKKKKKKNTLFDSNANVKQKMSELQKLSAQKTKLESDIKEIDKDFSDKLSSVKSLDGLINRLPIESLKDLINNESGNKGLTATDLFDEKTKVTKEKDSKFDQLDKLESDIKISKIDALLAKINCVIESVSE
jgi:uncharacterized protein YlbG (UPF0298 family)